ncbi:hypothetical protein GYMLUDRAFT_209354 [Collybiopsis luxurians FD-317 M1]|nr:hypothetical protein GYMLUDRAFT_209354 [Collybiopsis luxurians FD-317 M1]
MSKGFNSSESSPTHRYSNTGSPGPSSNGSGSSNRPSPISGTTPRPPSRVVDEDYDEGVADALMGLAAYRPPAAEGASEHHSHSPTISSGSRHSDSRPTVSHRDSISSNRSHMSPPPQPPLKRALSPTPDDNSSDSKRSRTESLKRRPSSPSNGRRTPVQSTRPSPIPFRTQPTSHSPDSTRHETYPPSPPLPAVLPPHPRPLGASAGIAHPSSSASSNASIALPPIATLSPDSSAPSPSAGNDERERERDRDRMQISPQTYTLTRYKWS